MKDLHKLTGEIIFLRHGPVGTWRWSIVGKPQVLPKLLHTEILEIVSKTLRLMKFITGFSSNHGTDWHDPAGGGWAVSLPPLVNNRLLHLGNSPQHCQFTQMSLTDIKKKKNCTQQWIKKCGCLSMESFECRVTRGKLTTAAADDEWPSPVPMGFKMHIK